MGEVKDVQRGKDAAEKEKLRERPEPLPQTRICPLSLQAAGVAIATYHITGLKETKFKDEDGVEHTDFLWRSTPEIKLTEDGKEILEEQGWSAIRVDQVGTESDGETPIYHIARDRNGRADMRGHALKFYQALQKMQDADEVNWKNHAYYFTQTEGNEALSTFLTHVLTGDEFELLNGEKIALKANKTAWDNWISEVAFDMHPELHKQWDDLPQNKKAKPAAKPKAETAEQTLQTSSEVDDEIAEFVPRGMKPRKDPRQSELTDVGLEDPVDAAMQRIDTYEQQDPPAQELEEIEAEEVTAATATLDELQETQQQDDEDDSDDHTHTTVRLSGYEAVIERMSEDNYVRNINGEDYRMYIIDELPECDTPIAIGFRPEDKGVVDMEINGTAYRFLQEQN